MKKIIGGIIIFFGIAFFFAEYEEIGEYVIAYILGIGFIILGIKFLLKYSKKEVNDDEIIERNINNQNTHKSKVVYDKEIKIKGTSFHQNELKKIASNGINNHFIDAYSGFSTKEIKEYGRTGQIEYEKLKSINLQPYEFQNEIAIKLLVNDYLDNFVEVGNIPKEEVNELFNFIKDQDNYEFIVDGYFVGGKYKNYDLYDEKMKIEELNIGIRLKIKIIEKQNICTEEQE